MAFYFEIAPDMTQNPFSSHLGIRGPTLCLSHVYQAADRVMANARGDGGQRKWPDPDEYGIEPMRELRFTGPITGRYQKPRSPLGAPPAAAQGVDAWPKGVAPRRLVGRFVASASTAAAFSPSVGQQTNGTH